MGDGTKTNYWNPGMDGVRVSVIHADSQAVTGTVFDLTNKVPSTGLAHFGKVSKLSYNTGKSLAPKAGNYTYINPSQSLPKIISTSSSTASIAAIRSYFTDEQVIRSIAGYAGMDFDTLIGGDYKLEQTEVKPQPTEPAGGSTNDAGQVYVPGFGYVDYEGDNVGIKDDSMYENGNKIGIMGG